LTGSTNTTEENTMSNDLRLSAERAHQLNTVHRALVAAALTADAAESRADHPVQDRHAHGELIIARKALRVAVANYRQVTGQ
jgi:hypothetical protein